MPSSWAWPIWSPSKAVMRGIDFGAVGLPSSLGLRIGAHAGPVIEFQDPLRDERNFYGTHVTQAARIEPRTPVGEVYVTHAFAAIAALDAPGRYSCQYVGRRPAAKDFGTFAMYLLKARAPDG